MTSEQIVCLIIFICVYIAIIIFHNYKSIMAWAGVALLFVIGLLPGVKILYYINWNILGIFWGSLVIAELFIYSKIPAYIAEHYPKIKAH